MNFCISAEREQQIRDLQQESRAVAELLTELDQTRAAYETQKTMLEGYLSSPPLTPKTITVMTKEGDPLPVTYTRISSERFGGNTDYLCFYLRKDLREESVRLILAADSVRFAIPV